MRMDQEGCTPLMHAAENGHFPMVEYLVEKGVDIRAQNDVSGQLIGSAYLIDMSMHILSGWHCCTSLGIE